MPSDEKRYKDTAVSISEIEFFAGDIDPVEASRVYQTYGCLIVRGLMKDYIERIQVDIETIAQESIAQLDQAQKIVEGWRTPNGTLFLPAPEGYHRDQQIMVLAIHYHNSDVFRQTSQDPRALEIVQAILGDGYEVFGNGQSLYKEPTGGHPKLLHQDSAYFQHRYQGPVAILSYVVDTNLTNGALYVVPKSHLLGQLNHIDTFSHLGLAPEEWGWEDALPLEGQAGDSIFFHVQAIHGSKQNFSDRPRPVFINRYRAGNDETIIGGTTVANRAESEMRYRQSMASKFDSNSA
ncbi:MAG: phytanoyl-CoA dioxygenase family protein [Candidatus Poribacteria bacterium]|nr:phytanoyl-CoA dioxygenase family protein [Candidatus Poribacteria bacterium]